MRLRLLGMILALLAAPLPAFAQAQLSTAAGRNVPAVTLFCVTGTNNGSGIPVVEPCGGLGGPLPVQVIAPAQSTIGAVGSGTTGSVAATMTPPAGKTAYICGWSHMGYASLATTKTITVANLPGGSQVLYVSDPTTPALTQQNYTPCLPATGPGTAITVTAAADANGTEVTVNAWGYTQ